MKLNNRLGALEQKLAEHVDFCSGARERLWDDLIEVAKRSTNVKPDEGWLKQTFKREMAGMALLEHANGFSTPALWAKVKELAGSETPVQKMFAGLEVMHGTV